MFMAAGHAIAHAVTTVRVDALDGVVHAPVQGRMVGRQGTARRQHAEELGRGMAGYERSSRRSWIDGVLRYTAGRKVLDDLDLALAKVERPRRALPLLLVRIHVPSSAWLTTFEATVAVVSDHRFALVALDRSAGPDVVDVRPIRPEPVRSPDSQPCAAWTLFGRHRSNRERFTAPSTGRRGASILFIGHDDRLVNVEQSLSPQLQIRWIRDED